MVAIVNNKLVSIWDIEVGGGYQVVANALSDFVKSKAVVDPFFHYENKVGTDFNHQLLENGKSHKWEHFYLELPRQAVKRKDDIGTTLSGYRSGKDVFKRGLTEITSNAAQTVLELIEQNSLYRGEEHKYAVVAFLKCKKEHDKLKTAKEKDNYCWTNSVAFGGAARIKNTAIGTLLMDISSGMDLDEAVRLFESKVAPTNYKRPTAVITKSMIANAQKKVAELGIEDSLSRRYAVTDDITINNILFADRSTKKEMNIFETLTQEAPTKVKNLDNIAKSLNRSIKESEEESFVVKKSSAGDVLELKFAIVKHIIKVKMEDAEKVAKAVEVKAKKEKILSLISEKEDEGLKGASVEDLQKMLAELS